MADSDSSSISITDTEDIDAVLSAGNATDDTKEEPKARRNRMRMLAERKRRNQVKNYFGELRALMPHVTGKCDKNTIVGHAIDYIQSLEQTMAMLEKRKLERALTQQMATVAAASSSSAPPQDAEGMVAVASDVPVPDGCHDDVPAPPLQQLLAAASLSVDVVPQPLQQQPLAAPAVPEPLPPQLPTAAVGQAGFQTWSWPNLVLNVSNDNAYINVCSPLHNGMENMMMVLSMLNNHGIEVVTVQVDSDAARSVLNIYARVARMGGENPSSEEVYKLAMSEILLFLSTN